MARVTKKPDVRREEFLDIALKLCGEVGYDAMSVESVTAAAGVAKGTFYHYFSSKDDLLFQMLRRLGEGLMVFLDDRVRQASGDATARLATLMHASAEYKLGRFGEFSSTALLYRPENFALRHRLYQAWSDATREVLRPVVVQGIGEGTFAAVDVESTLDVLLSLWFDVPEKLFLRSLAQPDADAFARVLFDGTDALWRTQERLLGVPPGSFAVDLPANLGQLMRPLYDELNEGAK